VDLATFKKPETYTLMLFSIITSIKSVKNRIISFFKDQSGFSSVPRHDWFSYKIKDRTILAFDKVENYLLFNEFLGLCGDNLKNNYKLDTSFVTTKRNNCLNFDQTIDICVKLLDKKAKGIYSSIIYHGNPYAIYKGDSLAQPLHEMNQEINTTINIPVISFFMFCTYRGLWVNDNLDKIRFMAEIPQNWYSIHIPIDLDKFFLYREDLEVLLMLLEHTANILMSTNWEYVTYPNDAYVDFRPIKGDIIRFIRLLRNYKNQYPFHTSSTFVSKLHRKMTLMYIRGYFFKLRLQKALKNRLAFFTTGLTTHLSLGILSLLAYYFIVPVGYKLYVLLALIPIGLYKLYKFNLGRKLYYYSNWNFFINIINIIIPSMMTYYILYDTYIWQKIHIIYD